MSYFGSTVIYGGTTNNDDWKNTPSEQKAMLKREIKKLEERPALLKHEHERLGNMKRQLEKL